MILFFMLESFDRADKDIGNLESRRWLCVNRNTVYFTCQSSFLLNQSVFLFAAKMMVQTKFVVLVSIFSDVPERRIRIAR